MEHCSYSLMILTMMEILKLVLVLVAAKTTASLSMMLLPRHDLDIIVIVKFYCSLHFIDGGMAQQCHREWTYEGI